MIRAVLVSVLLAGFVPGASGTKAQSPKETSPSTAFTDSIRPILERSCWNCHGSAQTSDLDLRTRESALRGGRLGPAIVPGRAEETERLPPSFGGGRLRVQEARSTVRIVCT